MHDNSWGIAITYIFIHEKNIIPDELEEIWMFLFAPYFHIVITDRGGIEQEKAQQKLRCLCNIFFFRWLLSKQSW